MAASQLHRTNEQALRARNTFRAAAILLVATVATALLQGYLVIQNPAWQLYVTIGGLIILALALILVMRLARTREWNDSASVMLIGTMLIVIVVISALVAGLGMALGLATLLATVAISTQTLPQNWINRMLLAGVLGGVLSGLLDLLAPPFQLVVPTLQALSPVIIYATLIVYGVLVLRQFRSYPLASKLMVSFLTVAMGAVAVVTFFADRSARAALTEDAGASLRGLAESKALTVGELLSKQVDQLQAFGLGRLLQDGVERINTTYLDDPDVILAQLQALDQAWRAAPDDDPLVRARLTNDLASELKEYVKSFPENVEVFVTDRYGGLVATSNRTSDYYQADEDWWQAAYNDGQGGIYIGQPEYDDSAQDFSSNIAIPLYGHSSNVVIGVLRTTYSVSALLEPLSSTTLGETGRAVLVLPPGGDRSYYGILTEDAVLALEPAQLAQLQASAQLPYAELTFVGVPNLGSQSPLHTNDPEESAIVSQLGWRVVVYQSREESLAPVEAQMRGILLIALLIAGGAATAAIVVGEVLSAPVRRLTQTAAQVSGGDLSVRAAVTTGDEVGALAIAFNSMTAQLQDLVGGLESQVAARTGQLRAAAAVGRAAASILDVDRLLRDVVNLITDRFGFYYAAIFTLDDAGKAALLRAATGEAGRQLKERGHRLESSGRSMVWSAMTLRKPRIALDVGDEAVRFANPLLPDTRSEIALPLIVGDRVMGALNVQSTKEAAFDAASASVLQNMADQIAVALNNADLFRRADTQARTQSRLLAATLELTGQLEHEALIDRIAQRSLELLEASSAGVWLPASNEELELVAFIAPGQAAMLGRRTPRNDRLVGRAFLGGRAIRVDDYAPGSGQPGPSAGLPASFHAAMAVPLVWQGRIVGTLLVTRARPGDVFGADDERVAQVFAAQAAAALAGLDLREQQKRTLDELDAANRRLTGEAWSQFFRRAGGLRQADFRRAGQPAIAGDWLPEVELAVAAMKAVAWSQRQDQTVSSPFQAAMAAPIILRGEVIGALQVGEAERARPWAADDLAFIQAVADQVALAVENARLIEQTQRAATREKMVAEAADKIHRPIDLEAILSAAVEEVSRLAGSSEVGIRLGVVPEMGNGGGNGHAPQAGEEE